MESGTHGRTWYTEEKNNIALTFMLETNCKIQKLEGVTLEIADTIIEVFKKLYNISMNIKKPNDIVYNGKKIGGILTQTKVKGEIVKYMIVGIGLNIAQEKFNKDIVDIASSIKNEFKIEVDRNRVITEFCNLFEKKMLDREGMKKE